jgi:hypothetical protein
MRTVTYKSVLEKAAALFSGKTAIGADEATALNVFINARAREYWERYFWPEWTLIEKRRFRPTYASASSYVAEDERFFIATKLYYVALRAVPSGQAPATLSGSTYTLNKAYWAESLNQYSGNDWSAITTYAAGVSAHQPTDDEFYQAHTAHTNQQPPNASYWGRLVPFVRDIDYESGNQGASATKIGEVKAAYDRDPQAHEDAEVSAFDLRQTGLVVRGDDAEVWLEFRKRPPSWTGSNYAATTTYAADGQAYDPTSGEFYRSLAAGNTGNAVTDTTKWEKIDFPYVLGDATAQAAYADMLKVKGQTNKYIAELSEAERLLRRQFDKLDRQQGQTRPLNVMVRT